MLKDNIEKFIKERKINLGCEEIVYVLPPGLDSIGEKRSDLKYTKKDKGEYDVFRKDSNTLFCSYNSITGECVFFYPNGKKHSEVVVDYLYHKYDNKPVSNYLKCKNIKWFYADGESIAIEGYMDYDAYLIGKWQITDKKGKIIGKLCVSNLSNKKAEEHKKTKEGISAMECLRHASNNLAYVRAGF